MTMIGTMETMIAADTDMAIITIITTTIITIMTAMGTTIDRCVSIALLTGQDIGRRSRALREAWGFAKST